MLLDGTPYLLATSHITVDDIRRAPAHKFADNGITGRGFSCWIRISLLLCQRTVLHLASL